MSDLPKAEIQSVRKKMNPALTWLWDMMSFYVSDTITIPSTFEDMVEGVREVLKSDTSGIVNSMLDFAINTAVVDYTIETDNVEFATLIENWLREINISLLGKIQTGINPLAKEYFRERWKGSSLLALRTRWGNVKIGESTFYLPTKMWFVEGQNIIIEDSSETRVIGSENYYIKIDQNHKKKIPENKEEYLFIQKPFDSWSSIYPVPFLIQRGLYKNLKFFDLISRKGEKFVAKALEYLLMMKKGSEKLAIEGGAEYSYSEEDLKKAKDDFKTMINNNKTEAGTPTYVTNFDTMLEHISPEYIKVVNPEVYSTIEKRLLSGLGLVEVVEGVASTRREGILNPKPFISEVENGIKDFVSLLSDVVVLIKQKNQEKHPKYFGNKLQLHYTPIKAFIDDSLRNHLRSCYDRGVLSKQTYAEVVGQVDFDIESVRRKSEKSKKLEEIMYPPVITNTEKDPKVDDFSDNDKIPTDKKGLEAKNYKGEVEELSEEDVLSIERLELSEEDLEESKIVKKKDGYHVVSEKTGKNLGGPYKTKKEAEKRLRQIEFYKNRGTEKND